MITVTEELAIPENELWFTASGSGGPGGQHVNKTSSRITLWFDVAGSPSLDLEQKERIQQRLPTRINKNGLLHISAQRHRSQTANREQTIERFAQLIAEALKETPARKKTGIPRGAKKRRLENKKHQGRKKQLRTKIPSDEQ
ncbi:ribosome-associated protein [Desulfosalsimonas propionicica]|uniref:Ribosome-associated protein n=1 Tax=Desulfosalsimonas propionicica TaxID=332175 RepID=A0A7W0HKT7_9BACT|nr:alternative ribosome rescue aminoacyl-tRNA hydrolase ArfB [Desulfosalsimonas propionicica]MBA2881421.1 ribosome-associated protein [Desulfosalsimonas propionicica]